MPVPSPRNRSGSVRVKTEPIVDGVFSTTPATDETVPAIVGASLVASTVVLIVLAVSEMAVAAPRFPTDVVSVIRVSVVPSQVLPVPP